MLKDMTDADLKKLEQKLQNLGVSIDTKHLRSSIEAAIGATPFNATVSFGGAQASLESVLLNKKYGVNAEVIASKLHDSIKAALDKYTGNALVIPKKKELRKAVSDALLSAGFEINIGKVKGLTTTINNALGSDHNIKVSVDPKKLADAIDKAVKSYKGGTQIPLEAKEKILHDSIRKALRTEKFPIKVIVDKAEAQDAVRQALQAAGLQSSTGFTASDKRAWDAQSRRMEAEAKAAAASALAQRRLAGAHRSAQRATDSHIHSSISLGSAMRGNIRIAGELGPMLASAYSVVALKNFMQKVVEIGGELEKQKLAMNAILGNGGFANTITSQINSLAVKSPFGVMELNQYAKQLTAFQIPYNELYDTMKRMADVSAAVGVDMGRIILAYGQVRAAKFLKGTELRQFTEANIPMIDMLARRFTKLKGEMISAGDVMDMISKKEVSFEDVKAVLWELTGEGGRFYNMQEVLSESVQAKWKNLSDAIDLMFADIAKSTSGLSKGLAEILTDLTSQWKTIASVITAAAIAFGSIKVVSLLAARSLDASGTSALKAASNAALLERRNARLAQSYRKLTLEEVLALRKTEPIITLWNKQKAMLQSLSAAQFRQLALTRQITKEEWSRMIALGRLSDMQKQILVTTGVMTQREIANIRTLSGWKKAFLGVGNAMRGVGRAMLSLAASPWTWGMAALSAVMSLWQKNSEEMEKAKEIGNNVATSAIEGLKNLKADINNFKPAEQLTDTQLTQGVEQMQQLIKDYSPTPIEDINNALVAQDGHIHTLVEQYEILRERINSLKDAYYNLDNNWVGTMVKGALKATDGGNWFTQLFDDNLAENAKDYTNALGRVTDQIAKYSREYADNMKNAVIAALNADEGFRKATSGMASYDEKLKFLAENSEKFGDAAKAFNAWMNPNYHHNTKKLGYFSNASQIEAARKELLKDTDKFIADYNSRLQQQGINPFLMTPNQKTEVAIAMKSMLAQLEDAGEDAKALIAQKLEESWGMAGMIIEDKIGPSMQEKFRAIVGASTDEGVKMAARKLQYEGYNALSAAEKETVKKLMEQAKGQTMADLGILNSDMQYYLTAHPLTQLITLAFASDKPSELATELIKKHGYPGLTESTKRYVTSWTSDNSVYSARNAAQSAMQAAKNELDAAKKAGAGVEAAQKKWDEVWATLEYLDWTDLQTKDQKSNKHTGSKGTQKDKVAEDLKQRFKDIKDAWSEFQKWSKTEGKQAAATRIGDSGLFSTLPKDKIPQTVEQYRALVADLEKELRAAGVKGSARESLLNELLKQLLDIDKTVVDEQLKLALDKVTKEAERQLENWNLYDKVRKATGNKELAMNLAFGINAEGQTDYVQMIKERFNAIAKAGKSTLTFDTATPELLAAAPEEVRKAWEKANDDILKYFDQQRVEAADLYNEYQTLADKITAINGKRQRALEVLNGKHDDGNGNMVYNVANPDERNRMAALINSSADWEIYRQGEDYLRFFSSIYSLALNDVRRIGETIKLHLNEQFREGKLNIKEYADEIRKVNEQIRKAEHPRSNFLLGITSGKKGILDRRIEKEEGDVIGSAEYKNAINAQIAAHTKLNNLKQAGVKESAEEYKKTAAIADETDKTVNNLTAGVDRLRDQKSQLEDIESIFAYINKQSQGLGDIFNDFKTISGAMGLNTDTDGFDSAEALINTMMAVSSGLQKFNEAYNSNDYAGMAAAVSGIAAAATENDEWKEDSKKSRKIKEATAEFKALQAIIDGINRRMEHFLGNGKGVMTDAIQKDIDSLETLKQGTEEYERILKRVNAYNDGGAYAYQMQLMEEQLNSLQKQHDAENEKKEKDKEALTDMENQMAELRDQILYFAEGVANDLYGIDLKGWASELGDALFEAWKRGEDGAEAFRRKAGDIIGQVVNNVLKIGMLEPMMQSVSDYLFGTEAERKANNGRAGAFGTDFELQPNEINNLAGMIMKGMEGVDAYNSALDQLEKILNEKYGLSMKDAESKSGLSAGIQSVTEDTADLLASYINGIRGDVSTQTHEYWPKLIELMPQISVISQAQLDCQRRIAENTLRNAVAAEAIMKSNDEISRLLVRVTQGGAKFCVQ